MARRVQSESASEDDQQPQQGQNGQNVERPAPQKTVQHMFLQTLIARRMLTIEMADAVYNKCAELCGLDERARPRAVDFIAGLEGPLAELGLEIKKTKDQETGVNYYVLINTSADAVSKLATEYNPTEIALLRAIIEQIMTAPDLTYCISLKDALRCVKVGNREAGQRIIRSFVAKGWLTLSPSQYLTLSTRSLTELRTYLKETFNDEEVQDRYQAVVDCVDCGVMVTSGYVCPNADCAIRLHSFCRMKLGAQGRCPDSIGNLQGCTQQWIPAGNGRFIGTLIGLSALGEVNQSQARNGSMAASSAAKNGRDAGGRKSARGQKRGNDSDEMDDDELDDD